VDQAQAASTGRRVAGAALLLAAGVLLSRLLGFVREVVLAGLVGRNAATDAYSAAFQLPDLLNYLLAGGALSIAFLPLFERVRSERGHAAAERLTANVLGTLGAFALALTAVLWLLADRLVALQFGFPPEQHALTVRLTRIVLPAQVFFVCGGIVRAALMADGHFRSQALAPVLYNLGIIAGGLALSAQLGVEGFAWGVLVGAALGALGSALWEARGRVRVGWRVAPRDPDFRSYLALAAPLMLGATLLTVDEWYDRWFGARLGEGTIATLRYARQLMLVPVAFVGQAAATAALPALSRLVAQGRREELDELVRRSLQASLALGLLLGAVLIALARPAVVLVYVRGAFTAADAVPVTQALQIFACAVPGWILQTLAVRPFYARGDMWRPMLLGSVVTLAAIPLYVALGPRLGASGLALAGTLAISANALATLALARRLHGAPAFGALLGTTLRTLAAALPAGVAAWAAAEAIAARSGQGALAAAAALAGGGAAFLALALPLALWLGDAPTRDALRAIARRLPRRRG
jgi:putative peptidoglycan lipid II flippase